MSYWLILAVLAVLAVSFINLGVKEALQTMKADLAQSILKELKDKWPCGHSRRYTAKAGPQSRYTQCSICKSEADKKRRKELIKAPNPKAPHEQ